VRWFVFFFFLLLPPENQILGGKKINLLEWLANELVFVCFFCYFS